MRIAIITLEVYPTADVEAQTCIYLHLVKEFLVPQALALSRKNSTGKYNSWKLKYSRQPRLWSPPPNSSALLLPAQTTNVKVHVKQFPIRRQHTGCDAPGALRTQTMRVRTLSLDGLAAPRICADARHLESIRHLTRLLTFFPLQVRTEV
jgi:hypothetical protein